MKALTFEEHSSVLAVWWGLARRSRTLVCLDAHLDLQRLSPARLRRLEDCTTAEQVAQFQKPHHLYPDDGYSYSIEDFLYPGHRLGLLEHIIWVAPPHVHTGSPAATLERLQQMDGVQFEDLLSFQRVPQGWIEGRLLGVPLTICDYRQLRQMPLPADSLVDIDADFFIALPADAPWVRPREVFEALAALPLRPELVTLSRSVKSGFTPLRYRFLADHLAALWEDRAADSEHFDRLFEIDALQRAGDFEAAASACRSELKLHPNCGATWHLLSLTPQTAQEAQATQQQAALLCPAYEANVLREACEFPNRGLPLDQSTVLALENRFVAAQLSAAEEALTSAALGLLHCHFGRVEAASECYRQATRHFRTHPELASALAEALIQRQRSMEALPMLQVALAGDKTAAGAHLLMGSIFAQDKNLVQAQAHLQAASAIAPAWMEVIDLRSTLHTIAGQHQEALRLRERCSEFRRQARQLAARFEAD